MIRTGDVFKARWEKLSWSTVLAAWWHGRKVRGWGAQSGVQGPASLSSTSPLPAASPVPRGHTGRRLAGRPLRFTGRRWGQDNHSINPKSTLFWTWDRRMHQIRTAKVWFPRVWAYLSLFARFLLSGDVSGACAGASPGWFVFSFLVQKKGNFCCV